MIKITAILAAVVLMVLYTALSWGYVGHTMYLWFVHPYFTDLPTFSVNHFIGFMMFATVITNRGSVHIKDEFQDKTAMYSAFLFSPWVSLFVAWFVKLLLM